MRYSEQKNLSDMMIILQFLSFNITLLPERRNENIKYFISSSGNRTRNPLRLHSHACALRHNCPPVQSLVQLGLLI